MSNTEVEQRLAKVEQQLAAVLDNMERDSFTNELVPQPGSRVQLQKRAEEQRALDEWAAGEKRRQADHWSAIRTAREVRVAEVRQHLENDPHILRLSADKRAKAIEDHLDTARPGDVTTVQWLTTSSTSATDENGCCTTCCASAHHDHGWRSRPPLTA